MENVQMNTDKEEKDNVVPMKDDVPAFRKRKRKKLYLTDPDKVRIYIQGLMIAVENGEIDLNTARLLTNQAEVILKSIIAKESEKQLVALEYRLMELEEKEGRSNSWQI